MAPSGAQNKINNFWRSLFYGVFLWGNLGKFGQKSFSTPENSAAPTPMRRTTTDLGIFREFLVLFLGFLGFYL